jgi:Ca2+-binding EF-hand superfamily protein
VNSDGTYDIDYDDGESERGVAVEMIRAVEATVSGGHAIDAHRQDATDAFRAQLQRSINAGVDVLRALDTTVDGSYSRVSRRDFQDWIGELRLDLSQRQIDSLESMFPSTTMSGGVDVEKMLDHVSLSARSDLEPRDLRDIVSAVADPQRAINALRERFERADARGRRAVTRKEFSRILRESELRVRDRVLDSIMRHFDKRCIGEVQYEQFLDELSGGASGSKKTQLREGDLAEYDDGKVRRVVRVERVNRDGSFDVKCQDTSRVFTVRTDSDPPRSL